MIRQLLRTFVLVSLPLFSPLFGQSPTQFQDDLVSRMEGDWKLEGAVKGNPAHHDIKVDWVFNHQFLRMTEKTSDSAPASERRYDSIWYMGWDGVSERYVMHLIDTFGGRFSETLGYGMRSGNQIKFVFEYPDGPFHTTYIWNPTDGTWQWTMEQKNTNGKWESFGNFKLTKVRPAR